MDVRANGRAEGDMHQDSLHEYQRKSRRELQRNQPTPDVHERMPRKRGTLYEVDDDWRREALRALRELGMSRSELATTMKVNKSSVTVLFRLSTDKPPGPVTSTLAKPIADFLKVPLPTSALDDKEAARALRLLRGAKAREPILFQHLMAQLEAMSGFNVVPLPTKKTDK